MTEKKVVLCYPVSDSDITRIEAAFPEYSVLVSGQDNIADDLLEADVFCGHVKVPVDWEAVVQQNRLRWIQSSAAGLDHCLVPEVINSEILVSGCSALFANQVAEHTLAILLGAIRRVPAFVEAQQKRVFKRLPTDDLHGKTVAIVGFGGNGRRIAELLNGLVDKIQVSDQFPEFDIPDYVNAYSPDQVDVLLEQADVLIVTLPLTSSTQEYLSEHHFSKLKHGAYFINVARGSVVDQEALVRSIEDGRIQFAALDVVEPEPLPADNKLWSFENVLITPHVGAQSALRISSTTELFCLNSLRFASGDVLINAVDKELQYPRPENRLTVDKYGQIQLPST